MMNRDRFVIFIFGCIIIVLGWMLTTQCYTDVYVLETKKENPYAQVSTRCYEITPGVFKCYSSGQPETVIVR